MSKMRWATLTVLTVFVACLVPAIDSVLKIHKTQKSAEAPVQQVVKNDLASQFSEVRELTKKLAVHCNKGALCLPTLHILNADPEMVKQLHALKDAGAFITLWPYHGDEVGMIERDLYGERVVLYPGYSREEYRKFLLGKP